MYKEKCSELDCIKTKNFGLSKDTIKRVKGATQKWTKTRKDTA